MLISDWSSDVCSSDLIKEQLPGVHTTLGLSNISFGLKPAARHVLNSVYLHECQQAGLDSAIVHAGRILPLARIPDEPRDACPHLLYDRRGTEGPEERSVGNECGSTCTIRWAPD